MANTVFFSWQTDRPTREGRNLIERALEVAVGRIGQDATVEEAVRELAVDRDTKGVPGSPPIVDTIFRKIDGAAAFVPDMTFVGTRPDGRPAPNPNVLIEYGWALKSLGHSRIIPVLNSAFGKPTPQVMPFDLAHMRFPIQYECPPRATDEQRKAAKQRFAKGLENALREYFASEEVKKAVPLPAAPPPFIARDPKNGQGRFRPKGASIGISADTFSLLTGTEVKLSEGPALWLRLMPANNPDRQWFLTELEAEASPQRGGKLLLPLPQRAGSFDFVRAEDGFGCYGLEKDPSLTHSIVFAFTTGEVWAVDSLLLNLGDQKRKTIPNVFDLLTNGLTAYADFLSRIGVRPPYRWIAGMEDLKNRALVIIPPPTGTLTFPIQGSCVADTVIAEGLHNVSDAPALSLLPFFAKLYDNCGLKLPEWFGK